MTNAVPFSVTEGFDALLGLTITELGDGLARGDVPVRDELKQPFGLLHGGVLATIAESLASLATAVAVSGSAYLICTVAQSSVVSPP